MNEISTGKRRSTKRSLRRLVRPPPRRRRIVKHRPARSRGDPPVSTKSDKAATLSRPQDPAPALALEAARYSPQCGCWRTGHFHVMPRPSRLRIVTWNIFFDEWRWQSRLDALLAEIARWRPDLIALQEVRPRQLDYILARNWVRADLASSDVNGTSVGPDGVLLLSRPAILVPRLVPLPSFRHRKLLLADVETAGGPLRVGVVHLESGRDAEDVRLRQLDIIRKSLPGTKTTLVVGDLNFDADSDPEEWHLPRDLVDCWRRIHPTEEGKTLDPAANALRDELTRRSGKHRRAMRCDRVLLRSGPPGDWQAIDIRRIGTASGAGRVDDFPSDHFGLVATIRCGSCSLAPKAHVG